MIPHLGDADIMMISAFASQIAYILAYKATSHIRRPPNLTQNQQSEVHSLMYIFVFAYRTTPLSQFLFSVSQIRFTGICEYIRYSSWWLYQPVDHRNLPSVVYGERMEISCIVFIFSTFYSYIWSRQQDFSI